MAERENKQYRVIEDYICGCVSAAYEEGFDVGEPAREALGRLAALPLKERLESVNPGLYESLSNHSDPSPQALYDAGDYVYYRKILVSEGQQVIQLFLLNEYFDPQERMFKKTCPYYLVCSSEGQSINLADLLPSNADLILNNNDDDGIKRRRLPFLRNRIFVPTSKNPLYEITDFFYLAGEYLIEEKSKRKSSALPYSYLVCDKADRDSAVQFASSAARRCTELGVDMSNLFDVRLIRRKLDSTA